MEIVLIGIICFCGAFVQALIGFGYAVFVTPLVAIILGPKIAIAFSIVTSTFASYLLFFQRGAYHELRNVSLLAFTAVIGTPIGIFFLLYLNEDMIRFLISVAIFISAFVALRKKNNEQRDENILLKTVVGLLSGIMRGTVSMGGPPVVIYQNWVGGTPDIIRNRMYAFFVWISPVGIIFLLPSGLINIDLIKLLPFSVVSIFMGIFIGAKNRVRISPNIFHFLSMSLLFFISVIGIINSILIWVN
jgi:uncharacterized protein